MPKLLETKKVKEIGEINSEGLRLWKKFGWLPEPVLKSYGPGAGRGSTLWWSRSVLPRIELIRALKTAGKRNHEIDKIFKTKKE